MNTLKISLEYFLYSSDIISLKLLNFCVLSISFILAIYMIFLILYIINKLIKINIVNTIKNKCTNLIILFTKLSIISFILHFIF